MVRTVLKLSRVLKLLEEFLVFFVRSWEVLEFRDRVNLKQRLLSYFGVSSFLTWSARPLS